MTKPRLAYVDHSYHQKTRATDFLVAALESRFTVDRFWDDSWRGGEAPPLARLNEVDYAAIVFFQVAPYLPPEEIRRLRCRNLVAVLMNDDVPRRGTPFWICARQFRHLSFSRAIHHRLTRLGLRSLLVQYFPDPADHPATTDFATLRGFFWQRRPEITWPTIRRLVAATRFDAFHLHLAVDPPGFEAPEPDASERAHHGLTTSTWFERREEFQAVLQRANVYFAPRRREGIGMSFLEAMAQGKCVVAADAPTMNEYIVSGENGWLYDPTQPEPIDLSRARELGAAARQSVIVGRRRWLDAIPALVQFVQDPAADPGLNLGRRLRGLLPYVERLAAAPIHWWQDRSRGD